MTETSNKIIQICTPDEFERFKSFHDMFIEYMKDGNLPREKSDKLFEDINDFKIAIVPIAKKVGIDLRKHIDTIREMWEEPNLATPEMTYADWSGDRVEEANELVRSEYEAKLEGRKAIVSDLDKVMIALYAKQPDNKNKTTVYINNSHVIFGNGNQTRKLWINNTAQSKQITVKKQKQIWSLIKKIPHWIYYLVGFLAALLTIIHYIRWI
jgi:hypothetical protein